MASHGSTGSRKNNATFERRHTVKRLTLAYADLPVICGSEAHLVAVNATGEDFFKRNTRIAILEPKIGIAASAVNGALCVPPAISYIDILANGSMSQTRQYSFMSSGVPREIRM